MDYSDDFPTHLRADVDTAIARAEVDYWKSDRNYPEKIEDFVSSVFLVLARQICEAVREGAWDGARARRGLAEFLLDVVGYVYKEKRQGAHLVKERDAIFVSAKHAIESSRAWLEIQTELGNIIGNSKPSSPAIIRPTQSTTQAQPDPETTASQISRLMDQCGLSQPELAHKVGIPASTVWRHLNGTMIPGKQILREYEQAFSKLLKKNILINRNATKRN